MALTLPGLPPPAFAGVSDGPGGLELAVEEVVLRGTPGGEYRMMSYGKRNPALSRQDFVERWKAEAGNLGGEPIPDEVKGNAYAQLHPVDEDPVFDAVNEVWFDDLAALTGRAEWFAARPVPAELMDPSTCGALYLRVSSST